MLAPKDIQVSYTVNEAALQADDKRENYNKEEQKYQNLGELDNYDQCSTNEVDPPKTLTDSFQVKTNLPIWIVDKLKKVTVN